jgi:predicted transcriptional regulator of viral defense system
MGVKAYLETTPVFTIEEFRKQFPTVTSYNLLSRAVTGGKVFRVLRGVYASNTGRYVDTAQDQYRIASKLAPDAVFSYHSALELLGVAHSPSNIVQYYSKIKRREVEFQGKIYSQYKLSDEYDIASQLVNASAFGQVSVTTKEQTLIDCLSYVGRGGGAEEILRSLSGFPYMDAGYIKAIAPKLHVSAIARIGWLLEQKKDVWSVKEKDIMFLQTFLSGNACRFVPGSNGENGWSRKWRLILPAPEDVMQEWIS